MLCTVFTKKKIKFDFCIFAKLWVQQMAKMVQKKREKKIKVLCTFHFVGCGLPVSPFLIYSTGWLLVATGSMIDPRLFCLTVSQSQSYGLSGWGWGWSKAFFFFSQEFSDMLRFCSLSAYSMLHRNKSDFGLIWVITFFSSHVARHVRKISLNTAEDG